MCVYQHDAETVGYQVAEKLTPSAHVRTIAKSVVIRELRRQ